MQMKRRLITLEASGHHGENVGEFFFHAFFGFHNAVAADKIGQRGVVENACGRIADIEKDLVHLAMRQVPIDQFAEMLGVAKGRERTVNQTDDLTERYVGGIAAQLVSTL